MTDNRTNHSATTVVPTTTTADHVVTTVNTTTTSSQIQTPSQRRPRRYIYDDIDLQHFLSSPSKDALYKFTIAMGKSCATPPPPPPPPPTRTDTTTTTTEPVTTSSCRYDPKQPLLGMSPGMACLHGALVVMNEEWIHHDFPPDTMSHHYRFGNPIFRKWHTQLQQRSIRIISTILHISNDFSSSSFQQQQQKERNLHNNIINNEDDEYDLDILIQAHEAGKNAARYDNNSNTTTTTTTTSITNMNNVNMDIINFSEQERRIVMELSCYLHDSFGHPIRLDYGTGHETSFHIFLFLLCQLRVFHNIGYTLYDNNHCNEKNSEINQIKDDDDDDTSTLPKPTQQQVLPSVQRCKANIISIYHQYLQVTRALQTLYMLEPAGSHGVWGLDDYYCLPFYFGACQLIPEQQQHPHDEMYQPSSIHNDQILQQYGDIYLYYGCIRFIKAIKKNVPFFESSPMLNDISNIATWYKISSGLMKLYEGEVLSKRQVVQHLIFGSLFPANWIPSQTDDTLIPPTETFRIATTTTATTTVVPPIPETRAPWAK